MEKKQPYDPFEFAEEDIDKEFRKGFVLDTGMEAGDQFSLPVVEKPKATPKKKQTRKARIKKAIKKKMDERS